MNAELRALMDEKEALESKISDISEALSAENLGGVTGPLVDGEGFPRADVDVHATRTLRHQLACLNTDHKALMQRVEAGLHAHYAALRAEGPSGKSPAAAPPPRPAAAAQGRVAPTGPGSAAVAVGAATGTAAPSAVANDALAPFAAIDEVAEGGPAASAGVAVGDKLVSFGSLNATNHDQFRALGSLTQRSVGSSLAIVVERAGRRLELQLQPRRWAGNGLLGCHLAPLP